MTTSAALYDPETGARWRESLTPARAADTQEDRNTAQPRVHNYFGMTPALAARALERVENRRELDSRAPSRLPTATPINGPTPPATTPPRPPAQETPPAPTQAAPPAPAPKPPPAQTPAPTPGNGDEHRPAKPAPTQQATPPAAAPPSTKPVQPGVGTTPPITVVPPSKPAPVQPGGTTPQAPDPERDPLLEANGPNTDPLPMPSIVGREVGKPWLEHRLNGSTVQYTILEGNNRNSVDAVVRDAEGNEISRARIVTIDATGRYTRWQNDATGSASYYESGAPGELGYGQHFAPGASTSGVPTSEFDASPDLTKVRTRYYDENGGYLGGDLGQRNAAGLYDNVHQDQYGNRTSTVTTSNSSGRIESDLAGQIDAAGYGWGTDIHGDRWEIFPDENGNSVKRRINPVTGSYEFRYQSGSNQIHELRDASGRLVELIESDADGRPVRKQVRVGDALATGVSDAGGHITLQFTDRSRVGSRMVVLPWEDRAVPRPGRLLPTPEGFRVSYDDNGETIDFGRDGTRLSYNPGADTRALWKRAVTFAGRYEYTLGRLALGTAEGIGAITGINDSINQVVDLAGSNFRLTDRKGAGDALYNGFREIGTTAFAAYRTLAVESGGMAFGDRSWDEAWRNIRRDVGANWNATSKFAIGLDGEGASSRLPETLAQGVFGAATFLVPVRGVGGAATVGRSLPRGGGFGGGAAIPRLSTTLRGLNDGVAAASSRLGGAGRRALDYGRSVSEEARQWGDRQIASLTTVAEVVFPRGTRFEPALASSGASTLPVQMTSHIERGQGRRSSIPTPAGGNRPKAAPDTFVPSASDIQKHLPPGTPLDDARYIVDPRLLEKPLTATVRDGQRVLVDENGVPHYLVRNPTDKTDGVEGFRYLNPDLKNRGLFYDEASKTGSRVYHQDDNAGMNPGLGKGYVNGTVLGSTSDLVLATWDRGSLASVKSIDVTGTRRSKTDAESINQHANTILNKLTGGEKPPQAQYVFFHCQTREVAEALANTRVGRDPRVRIVHENSGFDTRPNGWP